MARKPIEHADKIEQTITVGCSVVTRYFSSLVIGQVVHITPKQVQVKVHGLKRHKWNTVREDYDIKDLIIKRRADEMVVIESEKVLLYALKNG